MSSGVEALVAQPRAGRVHLDDETARCTLYPELESKRVGRKNGDDKKRGPTGSEKVRPSEDTYRTDIS